MPRTPRRFQSDHCYHLLNRGNAKASLFFDRSDYAAFLKLLVEMREEYLVRLLAYCLMPNHFHLVVQPDPTGSVSDAMHWVQTAYAARFRAKYRSTGHIFQGRFKAFPVQTDGHLLTVMRYVERNPVRASLVRKAQSWTWSSAAWRSRAHDWLDKSPVPLGDNWTEYVDTPQTSSEVEALRQSVARGTPYGSSSWRSTTARALGLMSTLRPRGRPRH